MNNITTKEYAGFIEHTLQEMVTLPVEGICIVTKLKGGGMMTSFYNSTPTDKIVYAGLIQQDAMIETLQLNKMINGNEDRSAESI